MRVTIELSDDHAARLKALAARRGDNGYGKIVAEALTRYFREADADAGQRRRLLGELKSSLSGGDPDDMRQVGADSPQDT